MADEMTPGEMRRTLERIEQAHRDANRAIDDRIGEMARKAVPAELWAAEHRALVEQLQHQDRDAQEARDRIEKIAVERLAAVTADIKELRDDLHDHEQLHKDSTAWSRSRVLTAIGITVGAIATLAGAWIAAVIAAKGVR